MTVPIPQNPTAPQTDPPAPPAGPPALGSQPQPPAPPAPPATQPSTGEQPLGAPGLKALQEERAARQELEKQVAALTAKFAAPTTEPSELEKLTERVAAAEKLADEERSARIRLEVAKTKGLTDAQAAELRGTTTEDLTAHADRLLAAFPAPANADGQQAPPPGPRPDLSQGARGQIDLDAQIADAEAKGDHMRAINLKRKRMFQNRT